MVDPLSILKTIYELANKINELVRKNKDNQKDSEKLHEHIDRVSFIVKFLVQKLEKNTNIVKSDDHEMLSGLLNGVQKTLERGLHDTEKACGQKENMMGLFKANGTGKKLQEIGEDISREMTSAMYATMACCFSEMEKMRADVKKLVNAVRARDVASISSTLPSLSKQTVEALPDLPPQVRESVQIYSNSMPYQNNDKREGNNAMIQRFKLDRRENKKGEISSSKQIQIQHPKRESISKQTLQLQHAQRENENGGKISIQQQIQLLMKKNNVSEGRKESPASKSLSNGEEAATATRQHGGHKMEACPSASSRPSGCPKTSPASAPLARMAWVDDSSISATALPLTTSRMSLAQRINMKGGPSSRMSLIAQLGMTGPQNGGNKMEAGPASSPGQPGHCKTSPASAPLARTPQVDDSSISGTALPSTTSGMSLSQQIDMKGGPSSAMSLTAQLGSLPYLGRR